MIPCTRRWLPLAWHGGGYLKFQPGVQSLKFTQTAAMEFGMKNPFFFFFFFWGNEYVRRKCQKMCQWTSAPSKDSDQPTHSCSLTSIFPGGISDRQEFKVSSCRQRRLWSDCADVQADLSSLGAQKVRFLMSEGTFSHFYSGRVLWFHVGRSCVCPSVSPSVACPSISPFFVSGW